MQPQDSDAPRVCSECGSTERYYAKGLCRPCYGRQYSKRWHAEHYDHALAYSRTYNETHRAERRSYSAAYRAEHPEQVRAYDVAYRATNGEKLRARYRRYDAEHREERRIKRKAHYWRAPEQARDARKANYWANPERERAAVQHWRRRKPELVRANHVKHRAARRKYLEERPEKRREYARRHRARQLDVLIETVNMGILWERDHGICGICHHAVSREEATLDHIVPLSRGGEHSYRNSQPAHLLCNQRKNAYGHGQPRLFS